ncbi:cbb3-type cytochrome oxidase assembly protein CcoS [Emcibacter sp.]|uniref:cbb3-type cytochrome oxidase assembly protein CcoS n=1 Tax=Emcibacter sp. TaxID=1979954 RepID=UPI002AA5E573|nr:cbb3-type cytochrome oxidase assembly protein CcoS [Emcibacter sp.]
MDVIIYLIPIALLMGLAGLVAFLWSLKNGQYDDLEGASYRALFEEDEMEKKSPPTDAQSSPSK